MIFVDSSVFIYAVGRSHPLRDRAQQFFLEKREAGAGLVTSAEVLQELLHVYLPVQRMGTLDAALDLATRGVDRIFPVTKAAVMLARDLVEKHPGLSARDLLHLAVCHLNGIRAIMTFDRMLQAAMSGATPQT